MKKYIAHSDLQIASVLTLLTFIFVLVPPLEQLFIRTILGLIMVLFLPGYALIAALFIGKDDLDAIERIALSFGLSIAVVPLLGLGLNYTPFGIRLVPIIITLSFFTISMLAIAFIRRGSLPKDEQFSVPFQKIYASIKHEINTKPESKIDRILTIILVISIIASVSMLVYVVVTPKQGEKFTEFYILGPEGMADNYPTKLLIGHTSNVIVGVVNHEYETIDYTIKFILANETLNSLQFQLGHNSTWEQNIEFTPEHTGNDSKLNIFLYRDNNFTESYRSLHLWIDITEANTNKS
ncbi:MAG TPA: DUF1616 domain-containing protein [Methanosarcinaceae archaeon]|nr:DUF1616 domain-containing protein [Methanosarcinaceae archaeon]